MKSKFFSSKKENREIDLWDAFISYLEVNYFPGASQVLDTKTIVFEYERFISCYA